MVMKQSDMTSGNGPMNPDKFFFDEAKANDYVDGQLGVKGRKAVWSELPHGDWEVWDIDIEE